MPFLFTLQADKYEYTEGEPIQFTLSIKNKDKEKSYPILLPQDQNRGSKLFYFDLYDAAKNYYRPIETETRNIENAMVHDQDRFPEVMYLKPGESVSFTAYINNMVASGNSTAESHHWFSRPLLPGKYNIRGIYNPLKTFTGDSLYNFYTDFEGQILNGKLNFNANGEYTNTCEISIRSNGQEKLVIDFWNENNVLKKVKHAANSVIYYINDTMPFARYDFFENGDVGSLAFFDYKFEKPWRWFLNIRYFSNGNISYIVKHDDNAPCPEDYYVKEFYNDTLLKSSTEVKPDGSVEINEWNELGQKTMMGVYTSDRKLYTGFSYHPKSGKIIKKRRIKDPCIDELEEVR